MTDELSDKLNKALEAVRALHSDRSGSPRDNLDAIREIIDEATIIEDALEGDCDEPE